jgi:hypothetical protein
MKAGKTYTISVTASDGSVYKITGTKKKIEIALARLEKKAAALAAAATVADSCRTNLCVNKIVNATTGEVTEVAFTEAEIVSREAAALADATRQIEFASAARAKYSSVGASDILGIPISVNGSSMTLTGTADELTARVAELQRAAVEAEAAIEKLFLGYEHSAEKLVNKILDFITQKGIIFEPLQSTNRNWQSITYSAVRGGPLIQSQSILEAWIRELVKLRNHYAHGSHSASGEWVWSLGEHLFLSSFIYPLFLKLFIEKAT